MKSKTWKKAVSAVLCGGVIMGMAFMPETMMAAGRDKTTSEVAEDANGILTIFEKSWRKAHDIKEVKKEKTEPKSEEEAMVDMIAGEEKRTEDVTLKGDPKLSDFDWVMDVAKQAYLEETPDIIRYMGRDQVLGEWKVGIFGDNIDSPEEDLTADSDFSYLLSDPQFLGTIEFRDDGTATLTPYQILSDSEYVYMDGPVEMTWEWDYSFDEAEGGGYVINSMDFYDDGTKQTGYTAVFNWFDYQESGSLYMVRP